ncbi:uncharacterized protein LOC128278842 [Anopheles cruzii]|uniref:uncharacterized protein LOC128278842 n=1 Tax=Anopheles cruzii TaxID=68878 RepID=UPI0022EC47DE|nr:uncharacterized protein LOC128278842 [Anopheles cruzii]
MEFTANDQIQQYYNYTCLSERNIQLMRRKILYKKEQYCNHFASVIKNTTELNEKLNPKLVINAGNLRDVLHDEAFLQIPYDYVMKIVFDLEQSIFSRRNTLNGLTRKIQFQRKQYNTLLMKIFTYNFEINNSKYTEGKKEALAASLKTNRCEASLRIARNVQNCLLQIGKFLFKDNLCNNTSLEFLKQNIQEQIILIHKTVKIGRPVIADVLALNKELKKLTNTFRINRKRNMRSLAECKLIMLKERSAIANGSMEEIDPKMWSLRFKSMTPSMEAFQNEKENLQVKIEDLKQAFLSRNEANVHLG